MWCDLLHEFRRISAGKAYRDRRWWPDGGTGVGTLPRPHTPIPFWGTPEGAHPTPPAPLLRRGNVHALPWRVV
jgi:hypothetical protein